MEKQKVAFYTLGCKLNYSETSTISKQFLEKGFEVVDYNNAAQVYVINTCTVTENAEKDCRQIVRRALRNNPNAYIIVTGCYAQLRPQEIASIEGVDAVLGSNEKFEIFDKLNSFNKHLPSCVYVTPTEKLNSFHSAFTVEEDSRTRAFFKIQDGCDYKCSFCTIPLARGKSRSLNPDEVKLQFKKILESGFKEIILTGVNVGDYGKSFQKNLASLLKELISIQGEFRIRISSIEPNLLSDEIIEMASSEEKICKHFHIPLQSGSPKILRLMQRRYTVEDYQTLILKVIKNIKDLAVGVDVIVGFPGETEDDFLQTYNFIKELPVTYLHVFTYSERPNTKAINLDGVVDINERKKRNNMLRILSEKKRNEFYNNSIDKELIALFEHEENNGLIKGFTSNYIRVQSKFNANLINKFVKVRIKEVKGNICTTEIVNSAQTN
ncbi:tRNA (N(6)-L-threonylcarbamoyladenosine(37)-C(2))-methylthiotransferase MtaB [Melioribacteraceae bacterium 4301-Me]|uniref:tRNA (N(6)-L-threonylcarbamoyladenosine(37)-C(2))- methylthiotransferase MtaB n=1 Tax=Pyranulibacter aquaticus TaxID=3163344 RepID=UPI00359A6370